MCSPLFPLKRAYIKEKNLVKHQKEIQGKDDVEKEVGLDFAEDDEILVHQ